MANECFDMQILRTNGIPRRDEHPIKLMVHVLTAGKVVRPIPVNNATRSSTWLPR